MTQRDLVQVPTIARRKVARHSIRRSLHAQISNGQLKPGSKLVQQKLAKQFGVSMGLIREAILDLQACGLVETVDNRGMFVATWSAKKLLESYDVREMLEGLAARLCCSRMTPQHAGELREIADRIFQLRKQNRSEEAAGLDRQFHHRIVEIADHSMLATLAEHYRFVGKVIWTVADDERTYRDHLKLIDIIQANQPELAERHAREHVLAGRYYVEREMAEGRFEPHWVV